MAQQTLGLFNLPCHEELSDSGRADVLAFHMALPDSDNSQPLKVGFCTTIYSVMSKTMVVAHYERLGTNATSDVLCDKLRT